MSQRRWLPEPPATITTGEVLVIIIAGTVAVVLTLTTLSVIVIQIARPGVNVDTAISAISNIMVTMIGLLAGFLAGRTDVVQGTKSQARQDSDMT